MNTYSIFCIIVQTSNAHSHGMTFPNAVTNSSDSSGRRKQQLINATIQTIASVGLSKTTVAKVAKTAGLSQGIVNFYFESKDHLLISTLEFISNEYDGAIESALLNKSGAMDILHAIVDASFDPQLFNRGKLIVWFAFLSESHAREEYFSICGKQDLASRNRLIALISQLTKPKRQPHLNSEAIARGLEGMIEVYWQEFLTTPEGFDTESAKQTCKDYLAAFFPLQHDRSPANNINNANKPSKLPSPAKTLPPWTYSNEAFFELEKQLIFKKNWLLVGHISDITQIGDYITFDAVGERALIIKGNDGKIRAFHNVCRHRGSTVVDAPAGNCPRVLSCPFHGWTYNLDGTLKSIPRAETFGDINNHDHGLISLSLEIWNGIIFINFANEQPSLTSKMADVEELIAPYQLEKVQPMQGTRYRQQRPYNWKIIHDIDNEGYHVPRGHPSLHQLYGGDYKDSVIGDIPVSYGRINSKPAKLWSVRKYQQLLPEFVHLPSDNQRKWLYVAAFPSMVLGLYPDMFEIYMTIPKSATETEYIGASYALPDNRREVAVSRYLTQRINRITDAEDEHFVHWIKEGMESSVFPTPQLSDLEEGVSHLHSAIKKIIPVATLAEVSQGENLAELNQQMS